MNFRFLGVALFTATTLVLALTSCGGSGSTSGSTTPPTLSLFAGNMGGPGSADGTGAIARFNHPGATAIDSAGNVYVADMGSHTIRKITPTGVVSTLAGTTGVAGSADGPGVTASFFFSTFWVGNGSDSASGLAIDNAGNLYVADSGNHTIRKITPAGVVSTLAGTAGVVGSADGTGSTASFSVPSGLAVDGMGNVYVADLGNYTIRKVTPAGVVSTLAGTAGVKGHADGVGAQASFNDPMGLATDSAANVYVADNGNHTIRKITPAGVVSTLAGTAGVMGFTPGSLPGVLAYPAGLAISGTSLYVTTGNGVAVVKLVP
jgi:sugar lactone lactonase YvrE